MIDIKYKEQCCGCASCVQKCPKHCITLHEDNEGFLYPHVDTDTCIDCGLCEKVCPVLNPYESRKPLKVLAAINKDEKIRMESSSGGIFTIIAETIINEGGVVFGARFDEKWQVTLDYTETIEGLSAFRGSKYVQARTADTYKQCEQFLKEGRKVLYTGSPCQIAGLNHYLRKEYDNLTTCDFSCHGVPSPKVWRMYLKEVVAGANKSISDIEFRNKDNGWKAFNFKLIYDAESKKTVLSSCHRHNLYMRAFLNNMILRPSCHACSAKEGRSKSDITIADFWRIQTHHPEMDDDKGTGLVLIHSKKGLTLIDYSRIKYVDSSYEIALMTNRGLNPSAEPHKNRDKFFNELDTAEGLNNLIYVLTKPSLKETVQQSIFHPIQTLRKIAKMVMGGVIYRVQEPVHYPSTSSAKNSICLINFRDKHDGWYTYRMVIELK